jgi:dihydrofolate reductase
VDTSAAGPLTMHVFLGMSVDGFIARPDGDLGWLTTRGEQMGDAGFTPFVAGVDAVLMGRATYDVIRPVRDWPYQGRPVHVVSTTLAPGADDRVEVHASFDAAVGALARAGHRRVYVDGGRTVRTALAAGLVTRMTLTQVPVLIGEGTTLFGPVGGDVPLEHVSTEVMGGGSVQTTYRVLGPPSPPGSARP